MNTFGHNIIGELNLLLNNIPNDLTELEKLRWIYIKLGNLFSYDYRVSSNEEFGNVKVDFESGFVSNYQTCTQICSIVDMILNKLNIKSRTIEIKNKNNHFNIEHTVNEVELSTGEKYLIDLTLDLYLIQSGCMTRHFGEYGKDEYDTLSNSKLSAIDEYLHLVKYDEYMDKKILDKKSVINGKDYSGFTDDEILEKKIEQINEIIPTFVGYNESRLFADKLLNDFGIICNKYNLTYNNGDKSKFIGCFQVLGDKNIWYIYVSNNGFIKTDVNKLKYMLEHGWSCKKETLLEAIYDEINSYKL